MRPDDGAAQQEDATMKAAIIKDYEGPIEIEDIGTSTIRDDSVLIAVHAALAGGHAVGKIVVTVV